MFSMILMMELFWKHCNDQEYYTCEADKYDRDVIYGIYVFKFLAHLAERFFAIFNVISLKKIFSETT